MTDELRQPDHPADPDVPHGLVQDLGAVYGDCGPIPDQLGETVAAQARSHFALHRRRRMVLRLAKVGAAAASVALVCWLGWPEPPSQMPDMPAVLAVVEPEDIDRNGRVDILDAFALARGLETPASLQQGWDITNDGRIDLRDVDAVAFAAVNLQRVSIQ